MWVITTQDYRWRAIVARSDWSAALTELGDAIDYPNFKSAVAERHGHERAGRYARVWQELYVLQRG